MFQQKVIILLHLFFLLVVVAGGHDLQGHPLVTLPSQRYPSLVQLNQADVIKLLKYLAFLSRFGHNFINTYNSSIIKQKILLILIIIMNNTLFCSSLYSTEMAGPGWLYIT